MINFDDPKWKAAYYARQKVIDSSVHLGPETYVQIVLDACNDHIAGLEKLKRATEAQHEKLGALLKIREHLVRAQFHLRTGWQHFTLPQNTQTAKLQKAIRKSLDETGYSSMLTDIYSGLSKDGGHPSWLRITPDESYYKREGMRGGHRGAYQDILEAGSIADRANI